MADAFGKYDVYTTAGSIYCYAETNVLKNRFDIHDSTMLRELEANLSAIRQNDLLEHPIVGRFSSTHLCRIHRYLFGDIYPFAGYFRREDIMKGTTRFLSSNQIQPKLKSLLKNLNQENNLAGLSFENFVDRATYYFAELNYIHPFREGNGRSTREFIRQLFLKNGYEVNWQSVSTERLLQAMENSVYDTSALETVLTECLHKIESTRE